MRRPTVDELVAGVRKGDARSVARLLSAVEDGSPDLPEISRALQPYVGNALILGVTGAPGVGKSTLCAALVSAFRAAGQRVGVLAIDPTSPFSGGALLGDRVRMQDHATDPEVYIRSMASRGHLGGLTAATPQAVRVLDAAGCSVIVVETVGVGQSEVDVAGLADSTLVLVAPGMGDAVQVAKAGILEVGDIYVVTKADREGAEKVGRDLRHMLGLSGPRTTEQWSPPIVKTASTTGQGIDALVEAIERHRTFLTESGELVRVRRGRARAEVEALAFAGLRARVGRLPDGDRLESLVERVVRGEIGPYQAADELLGALGVTDCSDD